MSGSTGTAHGLSLLVGPAWMDLAACRKADPSLFHPVGNSWSGGREQAAKNICARCPVAAACLQFGVDAADDWGIYGGLTAEERRGDLPAPVPVPAPTKFRDPIRYLTCPQGHPMSPRNLALDSRGHRYCLECKRIRSRAYAASKLQAVPA